MKHLLDKVTKDDVETYPWPHIYVKDCLSDDDCLKLIEAIPPLNKFSTTKFTDRAFQKGKAVSNRRLQHMMPDILKDGGIWAEFVKLNTGKSYRDKFMELFWSSIRTQYPKFKTPDKLKHCEHRIKEGYDIGWTVNIGANTPVHGKASSVLGRHTDAPTKLYFSLFYLRHPDDKSDGGDLEIYDGNNVVKTVKYERNVFVIGINMPNAIHAVTPRQPGKHPRLFANLYAEVAKPLFKPTLKADTKY